MASDKQKLSLILPPLVFGTATFNKQYNPDPHALQTTTLVQRALSLGVRAFDTSPYYGPAEELLGKALDSDHVRVTFPRESYFLITKVGRIASSSFDYSPAWIRHSVKRSLRRLHTPYLDIVYCHDVEFVSPAEVLTAIQALRQIRDADHTIKYVGISGYPVDVLCDLAEMILRETGEPLDAVMSYANFTLQNTLLLSQGVPRLLAAGVDVVPNASLLGMGLLRKDGVPVGGMGDWHPAPNGLREAVNTVSKWTEHEGEKLETVAIRFGLETWMREGKTVGSSGAHLNANSPGNPSSSTHEAGKIDRFGVSVIGVSHLDELDETLRIYRSVLDGFADDLDQETGAMTPIDEITDHEWSLRRRQAIRGMAKGIRGLLGEWVDFAWESPGEGFANERIHPGLVDREEETIEDAEPAPGVMLTPKSEAADVGELDDADMGAMDCPL